MVLWTIQPYNVYEEIQKKNSYRCDPKLSVLLEIDEFRNAYKWIAKQMKKAVGMPPENIKYPVWAWYAIEGQHRRPDTRKASFKVTEKSVLMEIEIPDKKVLLTDHTNWHMVLNNCINYKASYMIGATDEELEEQIETEDKYYNKLLAKEKIKYKQKSWEKIICSPEDNIAYIQATFWELKKEQIIKVWVLRR